MPRDLVKLIEDLRIEQMGCAGMIPGLQRSIDAAQAEMARLRARMQRAQGELQAAQAELENGVRPRAPKALPPAINGTGTGRAARKSIGVSNYWASMSKEERSAEMKRRLAVSAGKIAGKTTVKMAAKLHPRDPRHPEHEKWRALMSEAQRKRWAGVSKKAKHAHFSAVSNAKSKPNGAATL